MLDFKILPQPLPPYIKLCHVFGQSPTPRRETYFLDAPKALFLLFRLRSHIHPQRELLKSILTGANRFVIIVKSCWTELGQKSNWCSCWSLAAPHSRIYFDYNAQLSTCIAPCGWVTTALNSISVIYVSISSIAIQCSGAGDIQN